MDQLKQNGKDAIQIGTEKFVPYLTEEKIQERIKELGKQLSDEYRSKLPIFIGILNGSFMFLTDLMKEIDINCEIDFFKLSSYGDDKISSGKVKLLKELNADIFDSGLSMKYIEELISSHNPASMKVVTLLHKPASLKYKVKIDYIGFEIPDKFVIGYGLDYAQKYRNLRSIYVLSE